MVTKRPHKFSLRHHKISLFRSMAPFNIGMHVLQRNYFDDLKIIVFGNCHFLTRLLVVRGIPSLHLGKAPTSR